MDASYSQHAMAAELRGLWVGPMSVGKFIETFLPLSKETLATKPTFEKKHFATMADYTIEKDMYDSFIALVKDANAMPEFKLLNTSDHANGNVQALKMKTTPDVSCYRNCADTDDKKSTIFEDMELIFAFNSPEAKSDLFVDPPSDTSAWQAEDFLFRNEEDAYSLQCGGQIACYASLWLARQHRTHSFIVWIGGPWARIIRLDRSGGVVSESFEYESKGTFLLEFLWRFSASTDAARGMDPTVTRASADESKIAKHYLQEWKPSSDTSVFKLRIPDPTEMTPTKTREVLVWGPLADTRSVTGRATRGYPAWDLELNAKVFVKDSWRDCGPGMEKESDILRCLNEKMVRNVPQLICGDDLPGLYQSTLTQDFADEDWNVGARKVQLVKRAHSRFSEDFIGIPLYKFKSSKQFLQAVYDAFLAHQDAYEKCEILHRDISAGNVLMKAGGGGILNDWDLAQYVEKDDNKKHHQGFRSGTWQFMSIALLTNPTKIHRVQDDMESFFWLVLYHILRYMKHDKVAGLEIIMDAIFDQCYKVKVQGLHTGGGGKSSVLSGGTYVGIEFTVPNNPPMTYFLRNGNKLWAKWYQYMCDRRMQIQDLMYSDDSILISFEEASNQIPFEPPEQTITHTHMASLFATALAKVNWPSDVEAVDYLSKTDKCSHIEDDRF